MQFPWLEELVKQGSVSPEARNEIMRDCEELLKTALDVNSAEYRAFMTKAMPFATAASALFAGAGWLLWPKMKDALEVSRTLKDIAKTKLDVISHPDFADHQDKASARFDEITQLAPSVARNKPFMMKLVTSRLHSGLTSDDSMSLSSIQATYTPRPALQKKMQDKVAADRGEFVADLYLLQKEAGGGLLSNPSFRRGLEHGLGVASVVGTMALATGGIRHLVSMKDSRSLAKRQAESFEEAIRLSDTDREPLTEHKERARQAFKTLVHFAPHVASDPQAARAFMNRVVSYNQGVDLASIKDLADIEKNMSNARSVSPFMSGFGAGAKAFGLDKVLSGTAESVLAPGQHRMTHAVAQDMGLDYASDKYRETPVPALGGND